MSITKKLRIALTIAAVLLSACGGKKDSYTIGGTVTGLTGSGLTGSGLTGSGLTGSVVLQNNGRDNLAVAVNGSFTFATKVIAIQANLQLLSP